MSLKGNNAIACSLIHLSRVIISYVPCFNRMMGEAKRAVSTKSRPEGSICTFHLHREITYFCSHYFKGECLLSSNSFRNDPRIGNEVVQETLSVLNKAGRPAGSFTNHSLTDAEWTSAHVHVLINCAEVKPYLE